MLWTTWDPWREIQRLQDEINRVFSGVAPTGRAYHAQGAPGINIWTSENDAIVTTEIPGVDPKDIEISVTGDTLTIKGTRKAEEPEKDVIWHRRERVHGNFVRTIHLPFSTDSNKVQANYNAGVLKVILPRAEVDKPRKISVRTAD